MGLSFLALPTVTRRYTAMFRTFRGGCKAEIRKNRPRLSRISQMQSVASGAQANRNGFVFARVKLEWIFISDYA